MNSPRIDFKPLFSRLFRKLIGRYAQHLKIAQKLFNRFFGLQGLMRVRALSRIRA